ncbi:hypothetical protein A2U01_0077735, partial [Trifolium medium]|nr:hypothetical protein [Trifolium medium]
MGKGKGTAAPRPSSSHTAPAAPQGDSPSVWDPLLNPMEFIDKAVNIMGDISSLASVSTEELQRRYLGHGLKG